MIDPTEKTMKPSDSILHRVNATREPNQRTLTLAGGWEPGDTQSVVIAMLRDLDEQHAAQSAPARLTEKPYFEGLVEHQTERRNAYLKPRTHLERCALDADHTGDCVISAEESRAEPPAPSLGLRAEHLWRTGDPYAIHVLITLACEHCKNSSTSALTGVSGMSAISDHLVSYYRHHSRCEPPVPEEGERERAGSDPLGICEPEQCHKYQVGLIEQRDAQISVNKELVRERDEALARVEQLKGERDAALAKVEELKAELRKRDQLEASLRDDLDIAQTNAASFIGAASRAEAAERRVKELEARLHQHEGKYDTDGLLRDAPGELPLATVEREQLVVGDKVCARWMAPGVTGEVIQVDGSALPYKVSYQKLLPTHTWAQRKDLELVSDPPAPQELDSEGKL